MTDRNRDLSGFGGSVPRPPPRPTSEEPPIVRRPPPSVGEARPDEPRPKTKRITLSLPVETALWLKTAAAAEGRFYLDLILDAFIHGRRLIQSEVDAALGDSMTGMRPLRRRTPPGRVQVALLIPEDDLAALDQAAAAARLDRSGYVAELLERASRR